MSDYSIKIIDQIPLLTTEQASAAFTLVDFVRDEIWNYHGEAISRGEPPHDSPIHNLFEELDIDSIF